MTRQEYLHDRMRQMAVERALEIIGEAARRMSELSRQAHPEIPWRAIVGQRNVLVHKYVAVVSERIWEVATRDVPDLIDALEPLIPPLPRCDEP